MDQRSTILRVLKYDTYFYALNEKDFVFLNEGDVIILLYNPTQNPICIALSRMGLMKIPFRWDDG